MSAEYPILEFDESRKAIIEPSEISPPVDGMPERCVLPIYQTVIDGLLREDRLVHVQDLPTAMGPLPVYRLAHEGTDVAVAHPGVGAPLAAAVLEELVAWGSRVFVACGSAGVLDPALARGTVVVPDAAVRDEGTSYHYLPPGREIAADADVVAAIRGVLDDHEVAYRVGKTWTTDGLFRETPKRIAKRRAEGCLTVEMECAALLAVAAFRQVRFGQLLATGDDVSGEVWDARRSPEHRSFPERLFGWSVEACTRL